MKLLRVLRMLDDLAEVFLFDVLLATKIRRRLCTGAVSAVALAAYVSSGFWMAPGSDGRPSLVVAAPGCSARLPWPNSMANPALPAAHVELASCVLRERRVPPGQLAELRRVFDEHRFELDRYAVVAGSNPHLLAEICALEGLSRVSGMIKLFLARGILSASENEGASAVFDWITALRVSATLTRPAPFGQGPRESLDFAGHAVGGVLENAAVRLLTGQLHAVGLTNAENAEIVRALSERTPLTTGAALMERAELVALEDMLRTWAATNVLPTRYRGLRFYMPVVAGSRQVVAERTIALLTAHYNQQANLIALDLPLPPRPAVRISHVGGWAVYLSEGAGWSERLATLWSNDRAADLAARLLVSWSPKSIDTYAMDCRNHELEVAALHHACLSVLLAR